MNKAAQILKARGCSFTYSACTKAFSTEADRIAIPKRIVRGPTDILQALESTIKKDSTAPHYKYHDDPYLIPMSNIGKRTYSLAQESGRKTAHWIRAQHPNLFQHKECDPPIEAFFPKMVYNGKSEVTEADLLSVIHNVLVPDAVNVYTLLKNKGIAISESTRQAFLDLLCFYNHEDTLSDEFIEERWYKQSGGKEKVRKTWKDGELAEEVFISIDSPNAQTYSALIQGMAKYYQVDRAWQLFEEAQGKGLVLNVNAYNSIIRVASFLKEGYELRWDFAKDILVGMNASQVRPTLGTLNALLELISTMGTGRNNRLNALRALREFKALGIEASLASWYFVLITFCKERGPISFVLRDILPLIEDKSFAIQDLKDTFFFVTAMDVCRNHLHDRELALRIDRLLHHANNYDLIGDSFKESIYYRHYFLLMCDSMPLDEFVTEVYDKLVPHVYVPEPAVMGEILRYVEMNAAIEYLPRFWSDMTIFDHTEREILLTSVLHIMVTNKPPEGSPLCDNFVAIAWGVWTKIVNQNENRIQRLVFTGEMLGSIMTIALWNKDFEKASAVMNKLDKDIHSVVGVPQIEALSLYVDAAIEEKSPSKAVQCIQYCADCGFPETEQFAIRLQQQLTLDEYDMEKMGKIVGEHVLDRPKGETENTQRKKKRNQKIAD